MKMNWREELEKREREKEILEERWERDGTLCWYREPWEEDDYSAEDLEEVVASLWEDEEEEEEEEESWYDEDERDSYWVW